MSQSFEVYIGVDVSIGRSPFTWVVLDRGRKLRLKRTGSAAEIVGYLTDLPSEHASALVAVSPPWKGRKTNDPHSTALLPSVRLGGMRQQSFLDNTQLPPRPAWVREPLALVTQLQQLSYLPFPDEHAPCQWLEAPAETGFRALLGVEPYPPGDLEGRIQRQLVLFDMELDVPDAMEFFEEITRFRLMHSQLPYDRILSQAEINAWLAAATAWIAVHEPNRLAAAGLPEEGVVYHPLPSN